MGRTTPHPREVREAAYVLYTTHTNLSLQQVADFLTEKFGRKVCKVSVRYWLLQEDVKIRKHIVYTHSKELSREAVRLYKKWQSIRKVRVELLRDGKKVSTDWIRRQLHKRGAKVRPRGRPRKRV